MEYDVLKDFGIRLKNLREEKKLSQEKLAEFSGLDRTYISSVERGKRNISLKGLYSICQALELTLSDLFLGVCP